MTVIPTVTSDMRPPRRPAVRSGSRLVRSAAHATANTANDAASTASTGPAPRLATSAPAPARATTPAADRTASSTAYPRVARSSPATSGTSARIPGPMTAVPAPSASTSGRIDVSECANTSATATAA